MQDWIASLILGTVQGLTEFLPISSTGHLVIARSIFNLPDWGGFYDAVLHLGTLVAVLIFFYPELIKLIQVWSSKTKMNKADIAYYKKLFWWIIIGSVPALAVGYLAKDFLATNFRSVEFVAGTMIVAGAIFWMASRFSTKLTLPQSDWRMSLSVGLAQMLALVHGSSRSGLTMATGMYYGLKPAEAAKFSFFLSIPALFLGGGYGLWKSIAGDTRQLDLLVILVWFCVSLFTGWLAIKLLFGILQKLGLKPFAYYMVTVGAGLLIWQLLR
jgi:undecaprenyl-diphosphatase